MDQPDAPPAARVQAANSLLDRGWGKPTQPLSGDEEGSPIQIETIKRVIVDRNDDAGNTDGADIQAAS